MNRFNQEKRRQLYDSQEINKAIVKIAGYINHDYKELNPLLIGVLKGGFVFLADLVRLLDMPLEIDFIQVSSYGRNRESSGRAELILEPQIPVSGRHVLLIEDIVDTGLTTGFAMDYIGKLKPSSAKLCTLIDKPSRRKVEVEIHYCGLEAPDGFLVGYGLDCDEKYRNLPGIYILGG